MRRAGTRSLESATSVLSSIYLYTGGGDAAPAECRGISNSGHSRQTADAELFRPTQERHGADRWPRKKRAKWTGLSLKRCPMRCIELSLSRRSRIVAHVSHEPQRNFVRILMGDRVTVAVSARDRTRGRITQRQRSMVTEESQR